MNDALAPVPAPVLKLRNPTMDSPWKWLTKGWADMMRVPLWSFGYGFAFVAIGVLATVGLWAVGFESVVPATLAGFGILGPILAVGLYEISRRLEMGEELNLADVALVRIASPIQMGLLAFFLMFLFLVWMRVATLLVALFMSGTYLPFADFIAFVLTTYDGMALLIVGSGIGAFLALSAFALSVLSVPILMRRDVDAVTAIVASVKCVLDNPGPMLLWAWLIAWLIGVGVLTLGVGLIVAFPLAGHATWHAYRDLVEGGP